MILKWGEGQDDLIGDFIITGSYGKTEYILDLDDDMLMLYRFNATSAFYSQTGALIEVHAFRVTDEGIERDPNG